MMSCRVRVCGNDDDEVRSSAVDSKHEMRMSHHDSVWSVILCALGLLLLILSIPCCRCICFILRVRQDLKKENKRWDAKNDSKSISSSLRKSHMKQDGIKVPKDILTESNDLPPSYDEAVLLA